MKRSIATDPVAGDVLSWHEYTIRVIGCGSDGVRYTAKRSREEASAEKSQKLEAWAKWTPDAKVLERGDDVVTCTPTIFAGGPCSACGKQMGKAAHMIPEVHKVSRQDAWGSIEAGFYCAACCPAAKHGKTKPKKKAAE